MNREITARKILSLGMHVVTNLIDSFLDKPEI